MDLWELIEPREPERTALVRGLLQFREELLAADPWLPFPQNSCTFKFGDADRPLPIGGLVHLWENWPACTGKCPECRREVFGWTFGGLMALGGVIGCCLGCEAEFISRIGGMPRIGKDIRPILQSTPYFVSRGILGGAAGSARLPLVNALRHLGAADLPDDSWARKPEPPGITYTLVTPEGEVPMPSREADFSRSELR